MWFPRGYETTHPLPGAPDRQAPVKFKQVSAARDGTVWALDIYDRAFDFGLNDENKHWTFRGEGVRRVAVFSANLVLGIFKPRPEVPMLYGDLKRYVYSTKTWIPVHMGRLDAGTQFSHVAVGGTNGSVWAVAKPPDSAPHDHEDFEVVRYKGDIASGNGDWEVVATSRANRYASVRISGSYAAEMDHHLLAIHPFHDLAVGPRLGSSEPLVCVTDPSWTWPMPGPMRRKFFAWEGDHFARLPVLQNYRPGSLPIELRFESSFDEGIPPGSSTTDRDMEIDRWNRANQKSVSVGDDGTIVGLLGDRAYRYDGSAWTQLPGRWIDVSVVDKSKMWGIDWGWNIFSTIVGDS